MKTPFLSLNHKINLKILRFYLFIYLREKERKEKRTKNIYIKKLLRIITYCIGNFKYLA